MSENIKSRKLLKSLLLNVSIIGLCTAIGATSALAQNANTNNEEVIVTARKRDEKLQTVPLSVTAFSGDALRKNGVTEFKDLALSNSSVRISNSAGNSVTGFQVAVRGNFQSASTIQIDPSVGTYFDGILIAHTIGVAGLTLDTANVQTLKGPQGTLFGRNTTGGALLISSKNPILGEFSGSLNAEFGELSTERLGGIVNIPIGENVAARLVFQNNHHGNYLNIIGGTNLGHKDEEIFRTKVLFKLSDDLDLTLTAERSKESGSGTVVPFTYPNNPQYSVTRTAVGTTGGFIPSDPRTGPEYGQATSSMYSLNLTYHLDNGEVKFLTGHREYSVIGGLTLGPSVGYTFQNKPDNDDTSYEVQYNNSLFDGKLDFSSGLYAFDETIHETQLTSNFLGVSTNDRYLTSTTDSVSAYAQGTYHASDSLNLTLGLRYTKDKKTGSLLQGPGASALTNPRAVYSASSSRTNYLVTVDYTPIEDVMIYASTSTGYRAGGAGVDRQSSTTTNPLYLLTTTFSPESVTNYELGFKTQFLDRHLTLNGAIFSQQYKDYQLTRIVIDSLGIPIRQTGNTDATINGYEIDASYRFGAGTTISGNIGYVDAVIKDGTNPFFDGHPLTYVPQMTYGINLKQSYNNIYGGDLDFVINYSYRDSFGSTLDNPATTTTNEFIIYGVDDLALLNASVTYEKGPWEFAVFANNLTDEHYYTAVTISAPVISQGYLGLPRIVGARLNYSF